MYLTFKNFGSFTLVFTWKLDKFEFWVFFRVAIRFFRVANFSSFSDPIFCQYVKYIKNKENGNSLDVVLVHTVCQRIFKLESITEKMISQRWFHNQFTLFFVNWLLQLECLYINWWRISTLCSLWTYALLLIQHLIQCFAHSIHNIKIM